ncbi:hypothetical protein GmHk_13G037063 [Glycine max]|nr:hypothetical protein GmHk_13G037063 [Glycine max]
MSNLTPKLKALKLDLGEDLLMYLVLISLHAHFWAIQMCSQQKKDKNLLDTSTRSFGHVKKECPRYVAWCVKKETRKQDMEFPCCFCRMRHIKKISQLHYLFCTERRYWVDFGSTTDISMSI